MATIDVQSEPALDLTTFVVQGVLSVSEILQAIQLEYTQTPTSNVLWDLTGGSLDPEISADDFRRVAAAAKGIRLDVPGAKTAYVGSEDLAFGLLRMYCTLAEEAGIHVQYEVFRSRPAALGWLAGGGRRDLE
jgi:hypothetical protein